MAFLTSDQLAHFKKLLHHRETELREEVRAELVRGDNEQYAELAGRVHDRGDESVADLLVDLNNALIDQHITEIRQITAAQHHISAGDYGVCVDCEDEIELKRLENQPIAMRCFRCQSHHEKTFVQNNRPSL